MTRPGTTGTALRHMKAGGSLLVAILAAAPAAAARPTNADCNTRVNDTAALLLECIQQQPLWSHLQDFQTIADQNPGTEGHGNRDTGQPGYLASVNYVQALMTEAGYTVTIQPYQIHGFALAAEPRLSIPGVTSVYGQDWFVARQSGDGAVTAPVQPIADACVSGGFRGFRRGNIALIRRGFCGFDSEIANARAAGAVGAILYNDGATAQRKGPNSPTGAFPVALAEDAAIPVVGTASAAIGAALNAKYLTGSAPVARLEIRTKPKTTITDYNLIADSPYGNVDHTVVVEGHLDSIYGAGILDNASGSATILEIALKLAHTPTRNHLRYIWFGGEEINLLGSAYYTKTLSVTQRSRIVFDVDADVTATPNYAVLIADPAHASNVKRFPSNVVPASARGTKDFTTYFASVGIPVRKAGFGNDGTDSNSFSLIGIPNTGLLTQQDCCKPAPQVALWGGYLGNYEGQIPSLNGGCVDRPNRWCDNLANNNPIVLEFASKAVADVVFELANDPGI